MKVKLLKIVRSYDILKKDMGTDNAGRIVEKYYATRNGKECFGIDVVDNQYESIDSGWSTVMEDFSIRFMVLCIIMHHFNQVSEWYPLYCYNCRQIIKNLREHKFSYNDIRRKALKRKKKNMLESAKKVWY